MRFLIRDCLPPLGMMTWSRRHSLFGEKKTSCLTLPAVTTEAVSNPLPEEPELCETERRCIDFFLPNFFSTIRNDSILL